MTKTEQISGRQMGFLIYLFIVATLILSVPSIMSSYARQDAWISAFPASLSGIVSILVMAELTRRYPGMSIIQYSEKILGKPLGKLLGGYMTYYLFFFITSTCKENGYFFDTNLFQLTPTIVIVVTLLALCAYAVHGGIEVIGRCSDLLTPLVLVIVLPSLLLALAYSEPGRLLPVLYDGLKPVLQGAVTPSAWMSQLFFLGWLYPYLKEPRHTRSLAFWALGGAVATIILINLVTTMVFGPLTGRMSFSFFRVLRYIGIPGSFERLEAVGIALWLMGIFIKVSLLLLMLCLCISQWLGLKNYRDALLPATVASIVGSVWIFKNAVDFQNFITFTYPMLALFTQILIPILLLLVDTLKKKFKPAAAEPQPSITRG